MFDVSGCRAERPYRADLSLRAFRRRLPLIVPPNPSRGEANEPEPRVDENNNMSQDLSLLVQS